MIQRKEVITEYERTGSIRATARNLGLNRKTVKRYIEEYEKARSGSDADYTAYLKSEPIYHKRASRPKKSMTDAVKGIIDNCLSDNERKILRGDRKLCMRAIDIHQRLLSAGHAVSYATVTRYIRSLHQATPREMECYIRQVYSPGQDCEFDWGELHLTIGGRRMKLYMAVFTLAYSNWRMAFLFLHQDTQAFLEAHKKCFDTINGSPHHMVYDNMKVAVKSFVGEKLPTDALLRLERAYGFRHRFCNVRAGNEKGHVERSVEYVRRKAFSEKDDFDTIDDADYHLYTTCMDLNMTISSPATADIIRKSQEDMAALIPLKDEVSCYEPRKLTVDKYGTVVAGNVHYSVPDRLVGQKVWLHDYPNRVEIYHQSKKVAEHEKTPVEGWKLDIMHYIYTFERKPGSLEGSAALRMFAAPELTEAYMRDFSDNPSGFISLLKKTYETEGLTLDDFIIAYDMLSESGMRHVTQSAMEQLLFQKGMPEQNPVAATVHAAEIEKQAQDTLTQLSQIMNQN